MSGLDEQDGPIQTPMRPFLSRDVHDEERGDGQPYVSSVPCTRWEERACVRGGGVRGRGAGGNRGTVHNIEEESNGGYDVDQIQEVANRLESKLLPTDVGFPLGRFRIPTDTTAMSARDKIELLSEQITHVTDDEEED